MADPEVTTPEMTTPEVKCPACSRHYVKPTILTKCQHVLCKQCWDERIVNKEVTCPCCNVTADIRFLRLHFNLQKKVQEHQKEHRTKRIDDAVTKVTQLQETGREWYHKWVVKTVELRRIETETLEKINRSEKILIQMVRDRHQELRELVSNPVSATASEIADKGNLLDTMLTDLKSTAKEIEFMKATILSEIEANKVSPETDKKMEQCLALVDENEKQLELATFSDDLLEKVISFEWASAPIETTKAFLDKHCQIVVNSINPSLSESAQVYGRESDSSSAISEPSQQYIPSFYGAAQYRRTQGILTGTDSVDDPANDDVDALLGILDSVRMQGCSGESSLGQNANQSNHTQPTAPTSPDFSDYFSF